MNSILDALERLLAPLAKALVPYLVNNVVSALEARNAIPALAIPAVAAAAVAIDQAVEGTTTTTATQTATTVPPVAESPQG